MKTSWTVFVVLIMVLSFSVMGCMENDNKEDDKDLGPTEPYTKLVYEVNLTGEGDKSVFIPVPIDAPGRSDLNKNNISKILDHIGIISGEGGYRMVETKYGQAMEINFTDKLHIKASLKWENKPSNYEEYFFDNLTMENNTLQDGYNIYSEKGNVNVTLFKCSWVRVGEDAVFSFFFEVKDFLLKEGWRIISRE